MAQNIVARKKEESESARLSQLLIKSDAQTLKLELDGVRTELNQVRKDLAEARIAQAKAESELGAEKAKVSSLEKVATGLKADLAVARQEVVDKVGECERQKAEELKVGTKSCWKNWNTF